MADFIPNEIISAIWEKIRLQYRYMFRYGKNIKDLKEQMERLEKEIDVTQRALDAARRNGEEIDPDVQKWLEDVKSKTSEEEKYLHDKEEARKKCCFRMCPHYLAGRKLVKKAKAVAKVLEKGRSFIIISYLPELDILATLSREYEALESRKLVLNEILSAAANPNVNVIGIYGAPGVGKSTLVKEVARQAKEQKLFDTVVMAVGSPKPEIKKIQEQIADFLGLKFVEESEFGRAARLYARMKKEKSILVILDDIWETFSMREVGIPASNEHKGCKVLLTSRFLNVLQQMDSQREIEVGFLSDEEAWNLFKRKAGDKVENPELQPVAAQVCKECGGLPIAIVTAARALRKTSSPEA